MLAVRILMLFNVCVWEGQQKETEVFDGWSEYRN